MSNRYSVLSSLSIDEQREIVVYLCNFFSLKNTIRLREELKLIIKEGEITPLRLVDFFNYMKNDGVDYFPKQQRIQELIKTLKTKGILQSWGGTNLRESFLFDKERTKREEKGILWLGTALGCSYIGNQIEKDIVFIEGTTKKGDKSVGTGTLIEDGIILTCAHVVDDMEIDRVIIREKEYSIKNSKSHEKVDVAVIYMDEKISPHSKDLAFRNSSLLEPIVIAGYPTVPRSLNPCYTLQKGEISGHLQETMDKYPMDLFSAIARPGNSGGPVLGEDGCILGIVTRSLERLQEESDSMAVLPFFASVPSNVIRECLHELTSGKLALSWEDYS